MGDKYYHFKSVFFFPWKKKSARESHFGPFFQFFHGQKNNFTPTFWPIFQFFHAHFYFLGHFFIFSPFFFAGRKFHIHGQKFDFFRGQSTDSEPPGRSLQSHGLCWPQEWQWQQQRSPVIFPHWSVNKFAQRHSEVLNTVLCIHPWKSDKIMLMLFSDCNAMQDRNTKIFMYPSFLKPIWK